MDAVLTLIAEGHPRPSTAEIAERSGVSVRSVFRHFDDLDSLATLAVSRQVERILPLLDLGPLPVGRAERIELLVSRRAELFEQIGAIRRVGEQLASTSDVLRDHLEQSRRWMRDQVAAVFAPELDIAAAPDALLDALEAVSSWPLWVQLREEQGHPVARASARMQDLLDAVLR